MGIKEIIFDLCRAHGVSGSETPAAEAARGYLDKFAETRVDSNGNVIAELGNKNAKKTILLDAHLDRIGLMVTDINKNGFVKVDKCGGIDIRTLQNAVLLTESGLSCTVCCLPPHLTDGGEGKAAPVSKTWVDFGMTADEVRERVKIGDVLTFAEQPTELLGGRICSAALDNRSSVAALIAVAELIEGISDLPYKVVIVLSAQEETFGTGAKTAAYTVNAEESIVVDVSFASQPDVSGQYSSVELEKGPMIAISPILSRRMSGCLKELAEACGIPYQFEPISGRTGTNADSIAVTRGGVKTAVVSIPERYMHTQSEVVAVCDIENTARLIAEYIKRGGAFND